MSKKEVLVTKQRVSENESEVCGIGAKVDERRENITFAVTFAVCR